MKGYVAIDLNNKLKFLVMTTDNDDNEVGEFLIKSNDYEFVSVEEALLWVNSRHAEDIADALILRTKLLEFGYNLPPLPKDFNERVFRAVNSSNYWKACQRRPQIRHVLTPYLGNVPLDLLNDET